MSKYIATLIFYVISFLIIYGLNKVIPGAHDGGPGFGGLAIMVLAIVVVVLIGINIYRGFRTDNSYFIIAAIHLTILAVGISRLAGGL